MFSSWFQRRPSLKTDSQRASRRVRSTRRSFLRVEPLEDRTMPALVSWTGAGGDFNWSNALNWNGGTLPGASDDVVIDYGANNFTVTHASGSDSVHSLTSHANFAVSGGALQVAADSHLFGTLVLNATFGGSGNTTVDGFFTWVGTLQGVGGHGSLTANGGTAISGAALGGGFHYVNPVGQLTTWSGGDIGLNNTSSFENDGRMEVRSDNGIYTDGSPCEFLNTGTLVKLGGTTPADVSHAFFGSTFAVPRVLNSGTIDLEVGSMGLWQTTNSGTIIATAGTDLWLLGTQTSTGTINADAVHFHVSNASVTGSYRAQHTEVRDRSSAVHISGAILGLGAVIVGNVDSYYGGGTLDLTGATFVGSAAILNSLTIYRVHPSVSAQVISDAHLTVTGLFQWTGNLVGTGSLTANGGTEIGFMEADLVGGFNFVNPVGQLVNWNAQSDQPIVVGAGSVFENDGTMELWSDAGMSGDGELHNTGTFAKRAGSTDQNLAYGSLLSTTGVVNDGVIRVDVGTLGLLAVVNNGRIVARAAAGQPKTTLWLLGGINSPGSIDSDRVRFHTGAPVVFSITGSFNSDHTDLINRDSTVKLSGAVAGLGQVSTYGTLDLTQATFVGAGATWASLSLGFDGRSGSPPVFGTVITSADVTVTGLFTCAGGNLQGVGGHGSLVAAGGSTIGNLSLQQGFDFLNPTGALVTWNGVDRSTYDISVGAGSVFENDGTMELWNDAGMSGDGEFHNTGTFAKRAGSTDQNLYYGSVLWTAQTINDGAIRVDVGTLGLGNGLVNHGSIAARAAAGQPKTTLWLTGFETSSGSIDADHVRFHVASGAITGSFKADRTEILNSSSTVTMTGTVLGLGDVAVGTYAPGGILDLTNATFAAGATTLNSLALYGGTLISGADLTVTGAFNWAGTLQGVSGHGSLTANGGTTITGAGLAGGFHYVNPQGQTATWSGGIGLSGGSVFDNAGTMLLTNDSGTTGYDAASTFHNDGTGTLIKAGGNTAQDLYYGNSSFFNGRIINDGLIRVDVGTVGFGYYGAVFVNHGSLVAHAAAGQPKTTVWMLLDLNGACSSDGSIDADRVRFHAGGRGYTVAVTGSYKADVTQVNSVTAALSGTILGLGDVTVYGVLDLTGATFAPGAANLPSLTLDGGTLVANRDLAVAGPFTWNNSTLQGVAGHGSLTVLSDMTLNGTYYVRDFNLINAGHAIWTGGSVNFFGTTTSSFTNLAGATFDDQIDGFFGGVHPDCPIFYNQGLFIKSGGTGTTNLGMQLYNSGTVRIDQGMLNVDCGYVQVVNGDGSSGNVSGPITGDHSINNPGSLTSTPLPTPPPPVTNYTQTATGTLTELIGGLTPGTGYGQIIVNGNVNLAGTLNVALINGFVPSLGNQFTVIDNRGTAAVSGTFAGLPEGATVFAGFYGFSISYVGGDGNDVVLTTTIVNQPPTAVAGGPYAVTYGGSLTLNASGSSDPDGDALTYSWTINGHANAATGVQPTLTWSALSGLGIAPGQSYAVAVTVDDGHGYAVTSAAATLTVSKADQTINPAWPTRSPSTSSITLNLTSSSGLPVGYTVSGPATLANNVLTITGLGTVTVTAHQPGDSNYNAAADVSMTYAVAPASLCGTVFKDFNEDGFQDFGELGVAGVAVQLTGTDFNGTAVSASATTSASGYFHIPNLLPGTYALSIPGSLTVTEIAVGLNGSPPAIVGTGNSAAGLAIAEGTVQNVITFGVKPAAGDTLHQGQTAGIGFWNNKNGQALIRALNGGAGTQLGDWLAATFPNMYGATGANLAGQTNARIAAYFQVLFATRGDKLEAQVLATALSVYVTNSTLAGGSFAAGYGFTVAADGGTGLATFNIGSDGAAVNQASGATMTILDILRAVDQHATHATTAAGFVLYAGDQASRGLADDLFGRINDLGGI